MGGVRRRRGQLPSRDARCTQHGHERTPTYGRACCWERSVVDMARKGTLRSGERGVMVKRERCPAGPSGLVGFGGGGESQSGR